MSSTRIHKPAISIVIPTFNRAAKVLRAIDSVLRQSFADFELIVVDDSSEDQTKVWLSNVNDSRFRYLRVEHGGVAKARNAGVALAQADWLCFLDSDDVWRKHKLSEQVRYHVQHPDILISQTEDVWIRDSVRVNKMNKHKIREGSIFRESLRLCLICCSSVMLSKKLFVEVGRFDETLKTCEDYDLWLRILAFHPVGFIPKVLVTKFGGHADQLSKKYPMMDSYRLVALKKLLTSAKLNDQQREWVLEEIIYKENILLRKI